MTGPAGAPRVLILAADAEPSAATRGLHALLTATSGELDVEVVTWQGGPQLADLRAVAPVSVMTELGGGPGALAEKMLARARRQGASNALRRRRLGLAPWGRQPPQVVFLATPRAAPLLRYLPEPTGAPIVVLVPAGEMTDANRVPLSDVDLGRLLARADRFLVETGESWDHVVHTLEVPEDRVQAIGEPLEDERPQPPADGALDAWRGRLGIAPATRVVVGEGPLVWPGGADLFVRMGWILRERLGQDVALLWLGSPGEDQELSQLVHDITQMGLADHVHLLEPGDEEALWLGEVHVVPSRTPDVALQHRPAASRGTALVGWEAPLLRRFTGDDAAILVPFLDTAGLAAAVGGLLDDAGAREAIGQRAFARYCEWHVVADRPAFLLRLLRESR